LFYLYAWHLKLSKQLTGLNIFRRQTFVFV